MKMECTEMQADQAVRCLPNAVIRHTKGIESWTVCTEMQADQAVCCLLNAVIRYTKGNVSWVMSSFGTVLHNKQN